MCLKAPGLAAEVSGCKAHSHPPGVSDGLTSGAPGCGKACNVKWRTHHKLSGSSSRADTGTANSCRGQAVWWTAGINVPMRYIEQTGKYKTQLPHTAAEITEF